MHTRSGSHLCFYPAFSHLLSENQHLPSGTSPISKSRSEASRQIRLCHLSQLWKHPKTDIWLVNITSERMKLGVFLKAGSDAANGEGFGLMVFGQMTLMVSRIFQGCLNVSFSGK